MPGLDETFNSRLISTALPPGVCLASLAAHVSVRGVTTQLWLRPSQMGARAVSSLRTRGA